MYAVLPVVFVGEDSTEVRLREKPDEVREDHPESTVVAVSPPWIFDIR